MHFLRSSAIESWNQPRLKINSLDFYKMNFHTQHVSKKLFSFEWGASALRLRVPGGARTPIQVKKSFWKHVDCENSFCKKSRNLSWVGDGFSFQWLNFSKKCMKFCFVCCRCDMKIIFGVFDNLDAKLLSIKIFWCWHACSIWFWKRVYTSLVNVRGCAFPH